MRTLEQASEENFNKINASHVFLPLWTEGYAKDPIAIMQVGYAILLDKPLFILLEEGQKLPDSISKIARKVARFEKGNEKDMERATQELCDAAAEHFGG